MFKELYSSNKKILSLEFFPPKSLKTLNAVKDQIKDLSELDPDFITVTYGAGGGTRDLTLDLVSYIHSTLNVPAVCHLTCVGHSKAEIDSLITKINGLGVTNILALRGDLPDDNKEITMAFECARDLVSYLSSNKKLNLAVACYPEPHKESKGEDSDINYLKSKFNSGAEIGITQLFFDEKLYFNFVEKLNKEGINNPIVPGVMPIANFSQLKRFTSMCGASIPAKISSKLESIADKPEEVIKYGIDFTIDLSNKLLNGGAPGIHYYTLNKSTQIKPIVEAIDYFKS